MTRQGNSQSTFSVSLKAEELVQPLAGQGLKQTEASWASAAGVLHHSVCCLAQHLPGYIHTHAQQSSLPIDSDWLIPVALLKQS